MLQIAAGAAGGEPDLVEHQRVTDAERLVGTGMVVRRVAELGALQPGLSPDEATGPDLDPEQRAGLGPAHPAPGLER